MPITPEGVGPFRLGARGADLARVGWVEKADPQKMCGESWVPTTKTLGAGLATIFLIGDDATDGLDQVIVFRDPSSPPSPFKTAEGIGIGSTLRDLRRTYGDRLVKHEIHSEGEATTGYVLYGDAGSLTFIAGAHTSGSSRVGQIVISSGHDERTYVQPAFGC